MSDLIQKIEDHMDNIGEDYDSYGQAVAHERAVDTLLPLLKKLIEDNDKTIRINHEYYGGGSDVIEMRNKSLLKLLGENHE